MIARYIGNKAAILDEMVEVLKHVCPPGSRICDIFAGTLSVSLKLKRLGYSVIANDINDFSSIIGRAYLVNNAIPSYDVDSLIPARRKSFLQGQANTLLEQLRGQDGYHFLENRYQKMKYGSLLEVMLYLQGLADRDIDRKWRRSDFFDTYTETGKNSSYTNVRGQRGRRRFFTAENGKLIDLILNQIRYWKYHNILSDPAYALLISMLIRAVEKVSNTQGTYHAFPTDRYDARSLKSLRLEPPQLDIVFAGGKHFMGYAEDSLDFIAKAPRHDLLYMDPPYNFRQYTTYYFLLNLISKYCEIDDYDAYFADVKFMRGQNMSDDFVSTFSKKDQFIESLTTLVSRADTTYVAMSYFDGRNHWSDFKGQTNMMGFNLMKEFFTSSLFETSSFSNTPIRRMNYQSYGGYKSTPVNEYLFLATKKGKRIS